MARAKRVAALTECQFWNLTPSEVETILMEAMDEWRAKERGAAYHAAMICATLCNLQRDEKKKPQPYLPDDFLPSYEMAEEELTPQEFFEKAHAEKMAKLKPKE